MVRPPSVVWSVIGAVLLLGVAGWGALRAGTAGAGFMYDLEQPHPALASAPPMIDAPGTPQLARRVVIVIIDGLRLDTSRAMPYLQELRAKGVDGQARSGYPTWSRPNYVNILTGVPPAMSGVRTNRYYGIVTLDSLMDRVREPPPPRPPMRAGFASDYSPLPRLFLRPRRAAPINPLALENELAPAEGEPTEEEHAIGLRRAITVDLHGDFDDSRYAPWPGGFRDAADTVLASGDGVAVLLVGAVDAAGHAYGGDSEEYLAAASEVDAALRAELRAVDLRHDAVIIVADHGHSDRGGHGGLEPVVVDVPFILIGAGVVPGARIASAELSDVAPTAAALLGIAAPGHGVGRTQLAALALGPEDAARIAARDRARILRNRAIVDRVVADARADRLGRRALRGGMVVLASGFAVLLAWWLRTRGGLRLDVRVLLVGVPAFFIVYYTLIGTLGQRFSPSLLPDRGHIGWELVKYGAVGTVVHILAGWFALRRRLELAERLAAANGVAWLGLVLAMVPAGVVWAYYPTPYVEVPGPRLLVLIPAINIAIACYAVAVTLSLLLEIIVFFARAVDPRVRVMRLERAITRARRHTDPLPLLAQPPGARPPDEPPAG